MQQVKVRGNIGESSEIKHDGRKTDVHHVVRNIAMRWEKVEVHVLFSRGEGLFIGLSSLVCGVLLTAQ
jgi:hypothetical protein